MKYYIIAYVYLLISLLPVITGLFRLRRLDKAVRFFLLMLTVSFIGEVTAFCTAIIYGNNIAVYNVETIIEMVIVSLYFNYCIDFFRERHIGIGIAVLSLLVGIFTLKYGHSIYKINNYFMVYQGIMVIVMSILFQAQFANSSMLHHKSNYWITLLLIFFWTVTLLNWALYDYLSVVMIKYKYILDYLIMIVAAMIYLGFATIFLFFRKINELHVRQLQ